MSNEPVMFDAVLEVHANMSGGDDADNKVEVRVRDQNSHKVLCTVTVDKLDFFKAVTAGRMATGPGEYFPDCPAGKEKVARDVYVYDHGTAAKCPYRDRQERVEWCRGYLGKYGLIKECLEEGWHLADPAQVLDPSRKTGEGIKITLYRYERKENPWSESPRDK